MDQPLITKELLDEYGIELGDQDVAALLAHLNTTLEERVGMEITESLSEDQLKALLTVQESGNDEAVGAWLEQNVPELQEITQDEIDILLGELAENAEGVNNTDAA
ncbi:MAG: hypothetical protein JWM00_236 [Candidatus Saccharibacteria bacterium]|nr:hypothetical protein [Candidatus Saccharibacteria bacterium]